MAELLEELLNRNVENLQHRSPIYPVGLRKSSPEHPQGETVGALPGALLDFLRTTAKTVDSLQTGKVPVNAFEILPALGLGSIGVKGALGAFGGRLKPSKVTQLTRTGRKPSKTGWTLGEKRTASTTNVDPRMTKGEHAAIVEQLKFKGEPITNKNIDEQFRLNDRATMLSNSFIRMQPSQVRNINTGGDRLLDSLLERSALSSERARNIRRNDPLEQRLPERIESQVEGLEEGLTGARDFPGTYEPEDISLMNDWYTKLARVRNNFKYVDDPMSDSGFRPEVRKRIRANENMPSGPTALQLKRRGRELDSTEWP